MPRGMSGPGKNYFLEAVAITLVGAILILIAILGYPQSLVVYFCIGIWLYGCYWLGKLLKRLDK